MVRETKQRQIILETLKKSFDHPSADDLYVKVREQLPKISLGTVYRNLELLASNGLIMKIRSGGGQSRFDADLSEHLHFRCIECGKVQDVKDKIDFPEIKESLNPGIQIIGRYMEYFGYCDSCKK